MRLDLLLKQTRLIKRRTVAKVLCDDGFILANDKTAKPSYDVKSGDLLELHLGTRIIKVKINIEIKGTKEIPSFELIEQ